MDNAVAENVLAGNAMTRRATYHVRRRAADERPGPVGTGLGMALSTRHASA